MKTLIFILMALVITPAWAMGKPQPKRGTNFSAVYKNFDKSVTFVNPSVVSQGYLVPISAWSKAEGICKVIWGKHDVEDAQIEMARTYPQTMIRLGSEGQNLGTLADDIYVSSITCRD